MPIINFFGGKSKLTIFNIIFDTIEENSEIGMQLF